MMLSAKEDDDERDAEDFLAGYDMSALDDDPFEGSTVNDARGREAADSLERTPDARAELFRSTPTGPTVHSRTDGTSERSEPAPRTVALDMEPMRIMAAPETPPMEEADFDPEADGTRAALEALLAEQAGEAEYPVEREEDSILRSDQMQGAGEADRVAPSAPQDPALGGRTDFDAMASVPFLEDGSVDGEPAFPAFDDYEEGPNAEVYGEAGEGDPESRGALGADEDPELPGSVSPDASSIPGYPADDDEDVEAAMGIDDDEAAEEPGGLELAAPSKTPDAGDPSMRLDAGLPTDAEIGGATALDALRFPLHALGAGFSAAAGRSSSPFRSIAGPMREARSEGIEGRLEAKGETGIADRAAARDSADAEAGRASAERLASIRREPTDLERSREARLAADAERSSSLTSRRLDLTERGIAGEESESARAAAESEARRDPASPQSDAARRRLRAQLDALASSPRTRPIAEALSSGLDTMSADDVERIERGSMLRPLMGRGGGAAGGGGGGGGSAELRRQLEANGLDPALVDSLGVTGARAELRTAVGASIDREILSGVSSPILEPGEAARIRTTITPLITGYSALGSVERILREAGGPRALTDPRVMREIEPYMMALRGMVTIIQHTGTINESERPSIDASLPSATFINEVFGGGDAAIRGWRNLVEQSVDGTLTTAGVPPDGLERARAILRSGRNPAREPRGGGGGASGGPTVRVRDADGRVASVPAEAWAELPEEERAGYEVVE